MRKLLLGLILVVLVAVVAAAAFLLIPSPLQKWAAERGATLATGRQVSFGEPFRLSAWPPLTVSARDVRVANAEWGKAPDLARIEALEGGVDLLAFWRRNRVEIDRLIVTRPQVELEVAEDGRRNWSFGDRAPAPEPSPPSGEAGSIPGFVLGDIRIEGGTVGFDDRATGTNRRVEAVDLAIGQKAADQPVAIDGGLTMAGKRATLTGSVARPQGVAAGETSPLVLDLSLPGGSLHYDGTVNTSVPAAKGRAAIDLTAPRELLPWLGQDVKLPENALRTASLQAQLDLGADRVALDDLRFALDAVAGSGRAVATLGGRTAVEGEFAFGRVDLDPYLPPAGGAPSAPAPAAAGGWSDDPIQLPLPLPIDADLRLRAEGLKARQVELGAVSARLQADRQQATVTVDRLEAYGGTLAATARAKPGSPPSYAVDLQGQGVRLLPALQALAGRGRFDGQAEIRLALATAGGSQRQLVQGLGGDGKLVLRDGAVLGINIAGMLRQIMTLGLNSGAAQQQRTDFAEAGGSFRVKDGVLRNEDLYLRAPVLRLEGAGAVDLPQRTVDYRITPQLATTLEGQDASGAPALQAGVPFLVQGPFAAPSVRFDLNGTLTSAVSSPADLARVVADMAQSPQAVRLLRNRFDLLDQVPAPAAGQAQDLIKGVLGGGQAASQASQRKGAPNLGDAARGLLQRFGR